MQGPVRCTVLGGLRDRLIDFLSDHQMCVIATRGAHDAWAIPVSYENEGLELKCRLPGWSDVLYYIEQEPKIMAIIMQSESSALRWLQYRGAARISRRLDDRYVLVHIVPEHLDLIDETQGWGVRETLDL